MNDNTKQTALPSHTPGPWEIHWSIGDWHNIMCPDYPDLFPVAKVADHAPTDGDMEAEAKANARLIGAAPDLLYACRLLLSCAGLNLVEQLPGDLQAIERAKAAIAKARGQ